MYFGNDYLQDAIYEQTILNEMNINKNDLKDPKILDKVLKRTEKDVQNHNNAIETIAVGLGIAADVALGIATGSIVAPLIMFIPFIGGMVILTMKFIKDYTVEEQKNLDKLVKKAEELKRNTQKIKDEKGKADIIKKCDDIIKSVEDYKKNKIEEEIKAADEELEKYYKNPKSIWERSEIISGVIKKYKMSNEDFIKFIDKNKNKLTKLSVKSQIYGIDDDDDLDEGYAKYIKKFGKDADTVYDIFGNDEYGLIYEPKSKTIIEFCHPGYINFKVNMKTWGQEKVNKARFSD